MSNIVEKKAPLINTITHKEIKVLFNLSVSGAKNRLNTIRSTLGKTVQQKLTVFDFCKVEGISLDDFDNMIQRAYGGK